MSHPPGLPRDEPTAERSVAPTAGDSPFLAGGESLLSERSSLAPRPRGARARSIARDVDAKSLVDVVADFYVKATGKDGVQMRQQLANMKPAAVQQCRERWQKRAEEVQRFQEKKEEARVLLRRQGGLKDDFEREFKHRVMHSLDRYSKEDEKSLEKWTNELRAKAEAEEIKKMKQEDVRSRKALQQYQNLSYRLKMNESADLTICEFASRYPGDKHSNMLSDLKHLRNHEYVGQTPVNVVDWTVKGVVTPVKNREQQP